MVNQTPLIGRFEHLPGRPKSEEARPLLEKIASQVKPIMNKRGWKVGTLAEFLPSNPSLLGLNQNAGQRINLRLRPPGNENTFYEYDQVVLVMLHELTHNVHGPHDAKFYKLLGEIEEEYYDLKRKGYSGEGFHSEGNKLTGLKVDEYHGRLKGLAAAEKRLNTQKMIGRGGVLGGSKNVAGKSMKELIIEATERRLKDDKICGAVGHDKEVEDEIKKAQDQSVGVDAVDLQNGLERAKNQKIEQSESTPPSQIPNTAKVIKRAKVDDNGLIDLTGDSDEDIDMVDHKQDVRTSVDISSSTSGRELKATPRPASPARIHTNINTNSSSLSSRPAPHSSSPARPINPPPTSSYSNPISSSRSITWTCQTCTLINPTTSAQCEACLTPKPTDNASGGEGLKTDQGWYCGFCSSGPMDMERWSCEVCGEVRKWG